MNKIQVSTLFSLRAYHAFRPILRNDHKMYFGIASHNVYYSWKEAEAEAEAEIFWLRG